MKIRIEYIDIDGTKNTHDVKPADVKRLIKGKSKKEIVSRIQNVCSIYARQYNVRGLLNGKVVAKYKCVN